MPFTLSHTIATYLFKPWLKKLSVTGLVLGSMAPDFEYFLRMRMQGEIGHQLLGIVLLDVPMALIIALVFHLIIKNEIIDYLPNCLKQRFILYKKDDWLFYFRQHYWVVFGSIFLGISTHLIWDSFTHKTGWFVENMNFLKQSIHFMQFHIPIYKIFQHFSSVFGLVILSFFIYKLPKSPIHDEHSSKYWFWAVLYLIFIGLITIWFIFNRNLAINWVHILVASIAFLFWSLLIVSLIFKCLKKYK